MLESSQIDNRAREFVDHHRVGNVAPLGGHGHQQMVLDQPADQVAIGFRHLQRIDERSRVIGAEFRMVPTAALGNVVEQRGQVENFRMLDTLENLDGVGEAFAIPTGRNPPEVADHEQDMLIDGVDVKQIELHASGDARKRRDERRENTVAVHALELRINPAFAPKQLEKQRQVGRIARNASSIR